MSSKIQSNLQTVNHAELKKMIVRLYTSKKPLMVWGAPGIGKSAEVREAAEDLAKTLKLDVKDTKTPNKYPKDFCVVDIRLAQRDPSDLLGLPETFALIQLGGKRMEVPAKVLQSYIEKDEDYETIGYTTRWNAPNWLPVDKDSKGIIFLDELLQAPPLVRSAGAELVYDGRLGEWEKPEGYIILAATNRAIEAPIFEISPFLANRFCHVELRCPSVEEWTTWAIPAKVDTRVISYLQTHESAIYKFNVDSKAHAFPTPRSWAMTSDMIKGIKDISEVELYASATIGPLVAGEFKDFIRMSEKLPPTAEYIAKPRETRLPENEHDLMYSLCASLGEHYRGDLGNKASKETLRSVAIIADRMPTEYGVFLLKMCKAMDESYFKPTLLTIKNDTKEVQHVLAKLSKYLLDM
jgi:hypothetical protein